MSLLAVEKKKYRKYDSQKNSRQKGTKIGKFPSSVFSSSLGNQTNLATVPAATGYRRQTGTAEPTCRLAPILLEM